ncbi:MAG: LytTR family transcriptional regulator DNA-binding domain-containing protein [Lachnospiraceae bacterium]|nr:LytTR family transcriptional regulator DNA-binding domain-containing protein [Lachnospiraceae bacterium]
MLPIWIYANQNTYLYRYRHILQNIILMEEYPAYILSTVCIHSETCDSAIIIEQICSEIQMNPLHSGFYIIDCDSSNPLCTYTDFTSSRIPLITDGIPLSVRLAVQIRHIDPRGFIIIITREPDLPSLTLKQHAEVTDVILLSDRSLAPRRIQAVNQTRISDRILSCKMDTLGLRLHHDLVEALSRIPRDANALPFTFICDYQTITVLSTDILYITTCQRKLYMVTLLHQYEFYGSLRKCAEQLGGCFVYSHRSCLVNTGLIAGIDSDHCIITFKNGEQCTGSFRGIKCLVLHMKNNT